MREIKKIVSRTITITMEAGVFFLSMVAPVFAAEADGGLGGGAQSAAPTGSQDTTLFGDNGIFKKISNILIFIIGAVSVIMLIIGGFRYVISGGDSNAVESAKNTILYAIIGIVVAFLAFAAVKFVIDNLNQ